MGGHDPVGHMMALAAALPVTEVDRRVRIYGAVVQLDPDQLDRIVDWGAFHAGMAAKSEEVRAMTVEEFKRRLVEAGR